MPSTHYQSHKQSVLRTFFAVYVLSKWLFGVEQVCNKRVCEHHDFETFNLSIKRLSI